MEPPINTSSISQRGWNEKMCESFRAYIDKARSLVVTDLLCDMLNTKITNELLNQQLTEIKVNALANTIGPDVITMRQNSEDRDRPRPTSPPMGEYPPNDLDTWEKVLEAALKLADRDRHYRTQEYERLSNMRQFPTMNHDQMTRPDHVLLAHRPAYKYYDLLVQELDRLARAAHNETRNAHVHIEIEHVTEITPSRWLIDFLNVYDIARHNVTRVYPRSFFIDNIYTRTIKGTVIDDTSGRVDTLQREFTTYTPDLVIQLPRFAQMFADITFRPKDDDQSLFKSQLSEYGTITYKDFELALHFAVHMGQGRAFSPDMPSVPYKDFLRNPVKYMEGPYRVTVARLLMQALRKLRDTFPQEGQFRTVALPGGIGHGYELVKDVTTEGGATVKESIKMPVEIMYVLRSFVVENIHAYRRRYILRYAGARNMPDTDYILSPLWHMINFTTSAVTEFTSLYKRLGSKNQVNAQMAPQVSSMITMHTVYAMLMLVSRTVDILKKPEEDSTGRAILDVITACSHVDGPVIRYTNTTEAFPGLLFYSVLAIGDTKKSEYGTPRHNRPEQYECYFSAPEQFKDREDRIALFNTFSSFSSGECMPTITQSKMCKDVPIIGFGVQVNTRSTIVGGQRPEAPFSAGAGTLTGARLIPDMTFEQLKMATSKDIGTVTAGHINLLAMAVNDRSTFTSEHVKGFFTDMTNHMGANETNVVTKLDLRKNYVDIQQFFALPVVWKTRNTMVDASRVKSSYSFFAQDFQSDSFQNMFGFGNSAGNNNN